MSPRKPWLTFTAQDLKARHRDANFEGGINRFVSPLPLAKQHGKCESLSRGKVSTLLDHILQSPITFKISLPKLITTEIFLRTSLLLYDQNILLHYHDHCPPSSSQCQPPSYSTFISASTILSLPKPSGLAFCVQPPVSASLLLAHTIPSTSLT